MQYTFDFQLVTVLGGKSLNDIFLIDPSDQYLNQLVCGGRHVGTTSNPIGSRLDLSTKPCMVKLNTSDRKCHSMNLKANEMLSR
jgi:hypothetical protein